jgi:hypothetical protein
MVKDPWYPLNTWLGGPRASVEALQKRQISFSFRELIRLRPIHYLSHRLRYINEILNQIQTCSDMVIYSLHLDIAASEYFSCTKPQWTQWDDLFKSSRWTTFRVRFCVTEDSIFPAVIDCSSHNHSGDGIINECGSLPSTKFISFSRGENKSPVRPNSSSVKRDVRTAFNYFHLRVVELLNARGRRQFYGSLYKVSMLRLCTA